MTNPIHVVRWLALVGCISVFAFAEPRGGVAAPDAELPLNPAPAHPYTDAVEGAPEGLFAPEFGRGEHAFHNHSQDNHTGHYNNSNCTDGEAHYGHWGNGSLGEHNHSDLHNRSWHHNHSGYHNHSGPHNDSIPTDGEPADDHRWNDHSGSHNHTGHHNHTGDRNHTGDCNHSAPADGESRGPFAPEFGHGWKGSEGNHSGPHNRSAGAEPSKPDHGRKGDHSDRHDHPDGDKPAEPGHGRKGDRSGHPDGVKPNTDKNPRHR
eukprot:TRINITY_DN3072_c0_g1_i4.p2 TRINITY_DN3072_c0_g1~~TRINITY_DN3072_c0_g1_i4.p2  ORF type:complete len:263 (+),score=27.96 TRINITY_DN3072_c0_g1_i4:32-820(+)